MFVDHQMNFCAKEVTSENTKFDAAVKTLSF